MQATRAQTADSLIVGQLREEGVSFSKDNAVTLLMNGQEKFDDLFKAIRQARSSVHLEYFNFRNDSIANLLFDLLAERAAAGVEVRALFDGFGNDSTNKPLKRRHLDSIRARGIEIYEFDPVRFPWINHVFHRDHRKIVIVDGLVAYTGGMNVADYYIKGTPQVGEWRDMHCRIEGEEVNTLQRWTAWYLVPFLLWHVFYLRIYLKGICGVPISYELLDSYFQNPVVVVLYVIGMLAAIFHFCNGITTFCMTWGIAKGPRVQNVVSVLSMLLCAALSLVTIAFMAHYVLF